MNVMITACICRATAVAAVLLLPGVSASAVERPIVWIDACEGEPVEYAKVIEDLGKARVVYLGERHTLQRHHDTQAKIIADLAHGGASLVVALEPLESSRQPSVERFNRGEIDFDGLAAVVGGPGDGRTTNSIGPCWRRPARPRPA